MSGATNFSDLRNILAELYPDEASMRRLLADAGLAATRIILSSSAVNNWHLILSEAQKTNKVAALLKVVLAEYGENPKLRAAYGSLTEQTTTGTSPGFSKPQTIALSLFEAAKLRVRSGLWVLIVFGVVAISTVAYLLIHLFETSPTSGASFSVPSQSTEVRLTLTATLNISQSPFCPTPFVYNSPFDFDQEMAVISTTTFVMGDNDMKALEEHHVSVKSFLIDKFEVTNLQYQKFVKATQHQSPAFWDGNGYKGGTAFQPVTGVLWNDATTYCQWQGKRLPTEAEWELVCRSEHGYDFPWGNDPNPIKANTSDSSCNGPVIVGSYPANTNSAYGVADLSGNVVEWVSSVLKPYPYTPEHEVTTGGDVDARVFRGGAWNMPIKQAKCTVRGSALPTEVMDSLGFRCAKDVVP